MVFRCFGFRKSPSRGYVIISGENDAIIFAGLSGAAMVTRSAPTLYAAIAESVGEPEYFLLPPTTRTLPKSPLCDQSFLFGNSFLTMPLETTFMLKN